MLYLIVSIPYLCLLLFFVTVLEITFKIMPTIFYKKNTELFRFTNASSKILTVITNRLR